MGFKALKKVRVKRFTPTAQVLRKNLPTGCLEIAADRTGLEGVAVLHLLP
jgi:hypothetical protein